MTEQHRRWTFLEDNRALTMPGWLPPAEDCPALAELREAHLRVLSAAAEASRAAADLQREHEEQLEAVRASQEEALFTGKPGKVPEVTVSDAEVIEARERAQAARDALQKFVKQAVSRVRVLQPEIMAEVDASWQVAAAKRAEAQALLAEAARLEQTPKRIELWLARIDGTSALGHYPFDQLEAPPEQEPFDLELALAGSTNITEVETLA